MIEELTELVRARGVVVLEGAGMSTGSGIPDYRGPNGSLTRHTPMTYQEFTGSAENRRRYWGRSHVGWEHFRRAEPNEAHRAVAALERAGFVTGTITQNVDGLDLAAGTREVVELHGDLDRVVCLNCGEVTSRAELAVRLREANPAFDARVEELNALNPDGDADLTDAQLEGFRTVPCRRCGEDALKADVVFFGENVPKERVERSFELLDAGNSLLVLGSSLAVMSGYRFVLHAAKTGKPVAIVTAGPTRGDAKATIRLDAPLQDVLPELRQRLGV
ncbi:NAD-dependent protein deacetylase [Kineococcus rhizosphaerae]|uniref:protein acetyllysine N-acetyltransferase n=1 Tax=Kineococcus rhizosphaerae TaxID=559628 RepID=A0A2T0QXL0_9ACTN|nr:NAD-dependent protein deacetylase [Kineococcus rhizosphaerae]PRY10755.1 NAD-dependent SIR2 family protein deacetylase [Kineococcus rhizosphaerae]